MIRWFRRYGRPVALVVVGALWFAGFCVWLVSNHGMPEVRLPISTPYTRSGLAAGVLLAAIGLWLLLRVVRGSRRRRQSKPPRASDSVRGPAVAAPKAIGGGAAATPSRTRLEGAGGCQTAGSTWPHGWSRSDQTIPFPLPAFPGGGLWAGLEVVPPDLPGRPTQEFPPLCLRGVQRRRVAAGWAVTLPGGGVEAVARPQTPGGGPGTAARPQTPALQTWTQPAVASDGLLHRNH